ncbi:hypothetical protein HY745_14310, partial [Candidatus Desantisbacteria bacterium]|nr:hypothetical protein [Candidatus Desantisbacteria bacterium]
DIFACGIVLYELITGIKLFKGDTDLEILKKVQRVEIVPPAKIRNSLPKLLEDIILKALAKDPSRRFQTAAEMEKALERFLLSPICPPASKSLSHFMKGLYEEEINLEIGELKTFKVTAPSPKSGTLAVPNAISNKKEKSIS